MLAQLEEFVSVVHSLISATLTECESTAQLDILSVDLQGRHANQSGCIHSPDVGLTELLMLSWLQRGERGFTNPWTNVVFKMKSRAPKNLLERMDKHNKVTHATLSRHLRLPPRSTVQPFLRGALPLPLLEQAFALVQREHPRAAEGPFRFRDVPLSLC
ncbi:hypothetical protein UY3_13587 [Chelonia mydas]|uniref:Uncharacterized protein n=1 Tax=Chelonia mydas TaxID=8469 RepID=M7AX14_CHEMY|nr:hypothetical protein UY3_13587 [Chelonia mydas]